MDSEAVSAYQSKCAELQVPADDWIVRLLQAGPAHFHLKGRAKDPLVLSAVLAGVSKCSGVHSITLAENDIRDNMCVGVLEALAECSASVVDLSGNPLGDRGAIAIADMVGQEASFASLILARCDIGDQGAQHLLAAAGSSESLMALDLSGNPISAVVAGALARSAAARRVPLALTLSSAEPSPVGGSGSGSTHGPTAVPPGVATASQMPASVPTMSSGGLMDGPEAAEVRGGIASLHQSMLALKERLADQKQHAAELKHALDRTRAEQENAIREAEMERQKRLQLQAQLAEARALIEREALARSTAASGPTGAAAAAPGDAGAAPGAGAAAAMAPRPVSPQTMLRPQLPRSFPRIDAAVQRLKPRGPFRADDLVFDESVTDAESLAAVLRRRLHGGRPFAGLSNVLLAVKPPRKLRDVIFRRRTARLFADRRHPTFRLPAHLYRLGRDALEALHMGRDATVVLTGESGAGKTRAAAELVQFVLEGAFVVAPDAQLPDVFARCMTVMQAFCHAQTLHNPNASRAVRVVIVTLGRADPFHEYEISHVQLAVPMLLPSRLSPTGEGQRAFHILYWMVAGLPLLIPELAQTLGVLEREVFALAPGGIDAEQDSGMFEDLVSAMDELGIKPPEMEALFTALAGVLWLGELPFVAVAAAPADAVATPPAPASASASASGDEGAEDGAAAGAADGEGAGGVARAGDGQSPAAGAAAKSAVPDAAPSGTPSRPVHGSLPADALVLQRAASFLGLDETTLVGLLCGPDVPVAEAISRRNSLCAEAYDRIVQWVVSRLNMCLAACSGRHVGNTQSVALRVVDGPGLEPVHAGLLGAEGLVPAGAETFAVNYYAERMLQAMNAGPLAAVHRLRSELGPEAAAEILGTVQPADNTAVVRGLDELIAALSHGVPIEEAMERAQEAAGSELLFRVDSGDGTGAGRTLTVPHVWGPVQYHLDDIAAAAMAPRASLTGVLEAGPLPLQSSPSARSSLLLRPRLAGDALEAALPKSAAFFVACIRPDRPSLEGGGDSGDLDERYAAEQLTALGIVQMLDVMRSALPEVMTAHDIVYYRAVLGDLPASESSSDSRVEEILTACGVQGYVRGASGLYLLPYGSLSCMQALQWAQLKIFFADDVEQFTRTQDMSERVGIMRAMLETYFFRESHALLPLPAQIMDAVLARAQRHPEDPPETLFDSALSAVLATKTSWWSMEELADNAFYSLRMQT